MRAHDPKKMQLSGFYGNGLVPEKALKYIVFVIIRRHKREKKA